MNASPANGTERVVAAEKAGEREANASGQLTTPEVAGRRETKEPCPMETAESTGAQETNVPEERSAAVRRDGEPLASAATERRQEEAAADRHQAAAGERPPSSLREGIGPVPLPATDPGHEMRDAVGSDRPQLTAAKADRIETSRNEPSVTRTGGDLIKRMERQRPTAGRSVEGSSDIDVERHSCSTTDQQARLAAMKEQLASIAAQPRVLWLSTAGAETPVPAEADLVPAEVQLVPAEADQGSAEEQLVPTRMQLVPTWMQLVSARADLVPAEADLVPAGADLVPAGADLVPAEAPLVSTRARPADTARKRTPSAVTEDPGPVLPSEQEAGATALCAEATRPVESAEAKSPQSRAGMPAAVGEEPREPRDATPNPPPERRGAAGWSSWEDQLSCRNRDIFDYSIYLCSFCVPIFLAQLF
jgi:hypothetical protein